MNPVLGVWNGMEHGAALCALLPCNGAVAWAEGMVRQRPFASIERLFAAADEVWRALAVADWQQAFASHPRLGETHAATATARSLAWSRGEQGTLSPREQERRSLAEANRAYEARFGRIFLLCATGLDATEVLTALQRRLGNDAETELQEAAEQQRRITQLRLRKWLAEDAEPQAAACTLG